jgi:hypothetical protein
MSTRAVFLIVAAAVALHIRAFETGLVVAGYIGCSALDQWLVKRARRKLIDEALDDEMTGWGEDPSYPGSEIKGNLSRARLGGKEQIVVTRIASFLRRVL